MKYLNSTTVVPKRDKMMTELVQRQGTIVKTVIACEVDVGVLS